jgi:hypothetical protein
LGIGEIVMKQEEGWRYIKAGFYSIFVFYLQKSQE